jgi:hypothetical protein
MEIDVPLDAIIPERIKIAGKIEPINPYGTGKMQIGDDASGVAALGTIAPSGFDLRFERAGIRGGILIRAGDGRLRVHGAYSRQEEEGKENENKSTSHRPPFVAASLAVTTSCVARASGNVILAPT